ncbi:hypothetical protein CEXT_384001 [Caerostris extrusa]|uniref:Uncharacterized protein n=1 Tax=Caerostris extrusa TaxID=172846 RepID=A0AAV4YC44_CAEEX|nr:hypothetical protein CEXT_384001 [Caerostris extrusa]
METLTPAKTSRHANKAGENAGCGNEEARARFEADVLGKGANGKDPEVAETEDPLWKKSNTNRAGTRTILRDSAAAHEAMLHCVLAISALHSDLQRGRKNGVFQLKMNGFCSLITRIH